MQSRVSRARWIAIFGVTVAVVVMLALLASAALCTNAKGRLLYTSSSGLTYVPDEYIVQVQSGASLESIKQVLAQSGGVIERALPISDTYLVKFSNSTGRTAKASRVSSKKSNKLATSSYIIKNIAPNAICHATSTTPNDEYWDKLWGMKMINMPDAWDIAVGSSAVTVGVLDTGVANHPDLDGRIVPGYDFIDDDDDPSNDGEGHGTHVAGTIAAQGNNTIGVVGVCWDGVKIMPIRVLGDDGYGTMVSLLDGLNWALTNNVGVVNMSLGFDAGYYYLPLESKLKDLEDAGIIIVAAAGNDSTDVGMPAVYDECIAVAAVGPDESVTYYSNYGPGDEIDIAAPGGDDTQGSAPANGMILSTFYTAGATEPYSYAELEGTSMACPHVAGAAALLLSAGMDSGDVRQRLIDTARKPSAYNKKKYGAGILDVGAALAVGNVKITKPIKNSKVSSTPDFRIAYSGIDTDTMAVYIDYTDLDEDGIPDNLSSETPVLTGPTITSNYLNSNDTAVEFNWSDISPTTKLTNGLHYVYVVAYTKISSDPVYDWGAFTVSSKTISAGIHLFALPYALSISNGDGTVSLTASPSSLLIDSTTSSGVDFTKTNPSRGILQRYLTLSSSYATYYPNRWDDKTWLTPVTTKTIKSESVSVLNGGGYLLDATSNIASYPPSDTIQFPAGSGFWLILAHDAVLNDDYPAISAPYGFSIPLYKGWNMIGSPYVNTVSCKSIMLTYQGVTKSLDDAGTAGWIQPVFFGYRSTGIPGYETEYELLQPYEGYWIRSYVGSDDPRESLIMTIKPQ